MFGINPLTNCTYIGVEGDGIRLEDQEGVTSDIWRHPKLTDMLSQYGEHLFVRLHEGVLLLRWMAVTVAEIPGDELESSLENLLSGRKLLGKNAEMQRCVVSRS